MLLEDLLEEEKREQEKQGAPPLMSDDDFERLRADVLGSAHTQPPPVTSTTQGSLIFFFLPQTKIPMHSIFFKFFNGII